MTAGKTAARFNFNATEGLVTSDDRKKDTVTVLNGPVRFWRRPSDHRSLTLIPRTSLYGLEIHAPLKCLYSRLNFLDGPWRIGCVPRNGTLTQPRQSRTGWLASEMLHLRGIFFSADFGW